LTAFLIMAILPLSVVSWYTTRRSLLITQEEVTNTLNSIAALKGTQMSRWIEEIDSLMSSADFEDRVEETLLYVASEPEQVRSDLETVARQWEIANLAVLDENGQVTWSSDPAWEGVQLPLPQEGSWPLMLVPSHIQGQVEAVLVRTAPGDDRWPYIAATVTPELTRILRETAGLGQTGEIYLVNGDGLAFPQGRHISSPAIEAAIQEQAGYGLHTNYADVEVIGVYQWLQPIELGLLVEQAQEEAFAGNNAIATAVIAATLGVALATAFIAAIVTRQITQPLVQLTESALHIATGDLSSRVRVTSRDEIGILAHVFNRMASELEVLYNDLESKVAERTQALQRANYQIQRRAIQMQASLEVGQVITSILDPDLLLDQIVQVVRTRFVYSYAAVYTGSANHDYLTLRASSGSTPHPHDEQIQIDHRGPVGHAFQEGAPQLSSRPITVSVGPPAAYTRSEAALPLRLGDRVLGVLEVHTTGQESFDQDDVSVLQNVANQITIALENAGAYAKEREAAERLREADESKRRFLSNMSHELRTPLNNIIGFSRLLLKGIGGPVSEQQRNDLEIIYQNGQHLLGLINDLLDVSQIEAGLMELRFRETDLGELIRSVMSTASALIRGKDISLRGEISPELPLLQADPSRIRQVLLRLLANAAKFTEEGIILIQAHQTDGQVMVSISDTGIGIAPEDQARIFQRFEQGTLENGRRPNGAGLGLALSKEFVEMHGGTIWAESVLHKGSTFTFTLPIQPTGTLTETSEQEPTEERS
jgi:signal transduction histidine kinase